MPYGGYEIIDMTADSPHGSLLYRCFAPMPMRKYRRRREYLEASIPKGLRKKVLLIDGLPVGQIEYAPPDGSGYPIAGRDIIVMNCIWVLRKAKGRRLGALLMREMMESEPAASGFATLGLEGHWSPWLRRTQLEKLGFKSIESILVSHRTKHICEPFTIHLMWLPRREDAEPPIWNTEELLKGVYFCLAHPLYHPQTYDQCELLRKL